MHASKDDLEANVRKAETFCRQAKERDAHIAVMPEEWSNGCAMDNPDVPGSLEAVLKCAFAEDSDVVLRFRDLARELDMAVGLTYLQTWDSTPRNVLTLIDRHGKIAMTYAKVHTCPFLKCEAILTPGETFDVCTLDIGEDSVRVGAQICADLGYPETTRCLMLGGAEIVIGASGFMLDNRLKNHVQVRAMENAVGFAMACYPGPTSYNLPMAFSSQGRILYYPTNGQSIAFDHDGQLLALGGTEEEIVVASFDLDALRSHRRTCHQGNAFRRPQVYGLLVEQEIRPPFKREDAFGRPFEPAAPSGWRQSIRE